MATLEAKDLKRLANWAQFAPGESVARDARRIILQLVAEVIELRRQLAEVDRFKQIG